jgi:hypothetical protein
MAVNRGILTDAAVYGLPQEVGALQLFTRRRRFPGAAVLTGHGTIVATRPG